MPDQLLVGTILILTIVLLAWGKWRYDVVSILALLIVATLQILPPEAAFIGFTHPAVIIVASMFILSRGLINSGLIDRIARYMVFTKGHPLLQLFTLTVFIAVLSAFMNNLGALAFTVPIAIHTARKSNLSPAMFLLPLAFGSHLGGFLTLIGTPRNIIISAFREEAGLGAFQMFDFAYVGGGVALAGIIFLTFIGWRLIPNRKTAVNKQELFDVANYLTEIKVPANSHVAGKQLYKLEHFADHKISIVALIRPDQHLTYPYPAGTETLSEGDILLIQADAESLTDLVEKNNLALLGNKAIEAGRGDAEETGDVEMIVSEKSPLVGKHWNDIPLRLRYGVNLLAVARSGEQLKTRLVDTRFKPGDVLLLRGQIDSINESIVALEGLPLAQREVFLGRTPKSLLAASFFAGIIILAATGILSFSLAFLAGALLMILSNLVSLRQAYESIEWPVLILLGAMITFGAAIEASGLTATLSNTLLTLSQYLNPIIMVGAILIITMILADFINTTAAAVIMAPIAIVVAQSLGVSPDPLLMATAIGASCAFLTPTGHESNTLVMGAGGYKYRDYPRVGIFLELIIIAISLPLILRFWPL